MKQKISVLQLFLWILSFEIISYSIGFIARSDKNWYNSLVKSTLTPSPFALSIIWPILYAIVGAAGYFIWINRKKNKILFNSFVALMIITWSWSPIFFGLKMLELAHILMATLLVLTIYVVYESYKHNIIAFYLLIPFLCWVGFAYFLNVMLFIHN